MYENIEILLYVYGPSMKFKSVFHPLFPSTLKDKHQNASPKTKPPSTRRKFTSTSLANRGSYFSSMPSVHSPLHSPDFAGCIKG